MGLPTGPVDRMPRTGACQGATKPLRIAGSRILGPTLSRDTSRLPWMLGGAFEEVAYVSVFRYPIGGSHVLL